MLIIENMTAHQFLVLKVKMEYNDSSFIGPEK